MSKILDKVAELAAPVALKNGCELWDVEYVKEAGVWYLRVYIDRAEGVTVDLCEAVSRELDVILDEYEDLIPNSYVFEVSSAGAERQLRRPSDFERFLGSLVELKLYKAKSGRKEYLGLLLEYKDGAVTLDIHGETYSFTKEEIASVRLRINI